MRAFSAWIPTQHALNIPNFAGERGTVKYWNGRIRDHLVECHPRWAEIIDHALSKNEPITRAMLAQSFTDGICHLQLAESLYSFIG